MYIYIYPCIDVHVNMYAYTTSGANRRLSSPLARCVRADRAIKPHFISAAVHLSDDSRPSKRSLYLIDRHSDMMLRRNVLPIHLRGRVAWRSHPDEYV